MSYYRNYNTPQKNPNAVKGSMKDVAEANGITLAEAIADAEAILLVDISGSMAGEPERKAQEHLTKLQSQFPGALVVLAFNHHAKIHPGGNLPNASGGTDLAKALKLLHNADGLELKFILASDGHPDNPSLAMVEAARFTDKIDCIYLSDDQMGIDFLKRLARATGGDFYLDTKNVMLSDVVAKLLT